MGSIPFHFLPDRRVPEHPEPSETHLLEESTIQFILAQIQAEGGADSHEYHAVLYERNEPGGQEILFRRSQGSPDNPGSGIRDPFRNSLQIIFFQRSEWRRIHAGDGASLQNCLFLHRFERFFSIAQEKLWDPRLESTPVPCYYLRVDIEITAGAENFAAAVDHICNVKPRETKG